MKETTKMSRAVGQLEKMYNTINADLFGLRLLRLSAQARL